MWLFSWDFFSNPQCSKCSMDLNQVFKSYLFKIWNVYIPQRMDLYQKSSSANRASGHVFFRLITKIFTWNEQQSAPGRKADRKTTKILILDGLFVSGQAWWVNINSKPFWIMFSIKCWKNECFDRELKTKNWMKW